MTVLLPCRIHSRKYTSLGPFERGAKVAPQGQDHLVSPLAGTKSRRGLEQTWTSTAVVFGCHDWGQ